MSAAGMFLEILRDERVSLIFGNPGTTELPFIDALAAQQDLRYVLALQELSAVSMADGYARATGRPSFVSLHVAAGVANGLIGMLNASRSRTPMVVTAGQQDRRHLIHDPMLSGDLVRLASGAVKHAYEVQHSRDLPIALRRAFALAVAPPAGPVFLSVPMDLLAERESPPIFARSPVPVAGVAAGTARAAALLATARRPAIVAGDGVGRDGAVRDLVAVAEKLGATVYQQPMYDGINFPGNHPLYAGMLLPTHAAIRASLGEHDMALIVGCHAFMPHHYTDGPPVPDALRVVQLDADPTEIGRNFAVEVGLAGHLASSLSALHDELHERQVEQGELLNQISAHTAAVRAELDAAALAGYGEAPLDPLAAAHAVASGLPADAVVVEEAITVGIHLRKVLRQDRPRSYMHTVGGGLGWGIGAAIGGRLGDPDRPMVAVLGDGCAMFGIQGLWTAAQHRVPVTFVVMNNGEYRTLKDTLDSHRSESTKRRYYVGLDLGALDWTAAARFFHIESVSVRDTAQLRDIVATVGERDGPLVVDVPVRSHAREHGYGSG